MDYLVLTLPEVSGIYLGLAIQAVLRQHFLVRHLPAVLVAANVIALIVRHHGTARPFRPAGTYALTSLLILILFWPDITPFGRGVSLRVVAPAEVASYAASQDPEATIVTAEETGDVPPEANGWALETPGFGLLLHRTTEAPLALARVMNAQVHRPFASILPMQWFLGMGLTAETTRALQDWLEGCYKPALLTDREFADAVSAEQLLPWGNTPVAQALASRETLPGAHTGKGYFRNTGALGTVFLSNPDSPNTVRCDVYLAAVEQNVQQWLFTQTSPNGTPLSQVFNEELGGLTAEEQARFILHREMLRLMGSPVPPPSLAGSYAALTGVNAAVGALKGALGSDSGKVMMGALLGSGGAMARQAEQAVQWLLWWVAAAAWLVYWLPYILSILLMISVGFFPVVVLWALVPGQQLKALAFYGVGLLWTCSSPVWFALVDLAARLAASQAPQSADALLALFNWAPAQTYAVVVTVIGLALTPVALGAMLFVSLRGTQSLLRSVG